LIGARFDGAFEEDARTSLGFWKSARTSSEDFPVVENADSREESFGLSREAGFGE